MVYNTVVRAQIPDTEVCGGLSSIEGALNWLLLHVPENRIPKEMGSIPSASTKSRVKRAKQNMVVARKHFYCLEYLQIVYCHWIQKRNTCELKQQL